MDMEKLVSLCKRRGFIFPSSEIYGGLNGFWDYGPLGVELKRNIKEAWWRDMVTGHDDLGTLPGGTNSNASGINIFGQVVGSGDFANSQGKSHALVWNCPTGMLDLNDHIGPHPHYELLAAQAINAAGQILATGPLQGRDHAFLLTP